MIHTYLCRAPRTTTTDVASTALPTPRLSLPLPPRTLSLSLASSFSLSSPVLRPRLGSSLARAASSRVGGPPGGRKAGRRAGCHWPSSRVANQDAKGARPGYAPSPRSPRRFETDHEERRTRHVRRKREDPLVSPPQLSPREFQTPSGPFPSLLS